MKDIKPTNEKGEPHGYWEVYWSNGRLYYKGNYVNGNRDGYWVLKTINLNYLNGVRHGYYESFWDESKEHLFTKGYYYMDKSVGYWEWYGRKNGLTIKQFHL